jgi:Uma2 family endonuclease
MLQATPEGEVMGVPVVDTGPMTIEDFYAFTDRRPDEEKWELIDGEPVLNASPALVHQRIVANLLYFLGSLQRGGARSWEAIPGIGIRLSSTKRPEPDVLIRPRTAPRSESMGRDCDDAIVAFEVLSPSTEDLDLRWKRQAYATLPSLTHYVVIAQDAVDAVVFWREAGFSERRFNRLTGSLEFPALAITLPVHEIYRDTGLESD